jgi:hypothetical protein
MITMRTTINNCTPTKRQSSIAQTGELFAIACNRAAVRTLPRVLLKIHVYTIDTEIRESAHTQKFVKYRLLPGTKNWPICQEAQMTPRIILEIRAFHLAWKRGRTYPRHPNSSAMPLKINTPMNERIIIQGGLGKARKG